MIVIYYKYNIDISTVIIINTVITVLKFFFTLLYTFSVL